MWTIKHFEEVYDRYLSSDLSVKDFCENECILQSKFYYWKKKLPEYNNKKEGHPDFIPIVFSGAKQQMQVKKSVGQKLNPEHLHSSDDNILEIVYPNGVKLRVPAESDLARIHSLILLTR